LQIRDNFEEIARRWIPARAKHLVKSLHMKPGLFGQGWKPDRGIDVIAQEFLAERHLSGQKAFQRITQEPSAKGGISPRICLNCFSKISSQSHFLVLVFLFFSSQLVVLPSFQGKLNIILLAFLCAASKKNHNFPTVFSEVNAITWSEVDSAFKHAGSHTFDVGKVSQANAVKSRCHLSTGFHIQPAAPLAKRAMPSGVEIFAEVDHCFDSSIYFTKAAPRPQVLS
jgi:hypothetical protein